VQVTSSSERYFNTVSEGTDVLTKIFNNNEGNVTVKARVV